MASLRIAPADGWLGAPSRVNTSCGGRELRTTTSMTRSDPLPVSLQWQLPGRPAQIVSRLRPGVELAEHVVHGVDDRLGLIQLNLVT